MKIADEPQRGSYGSPFLGGNAQYRNIGGKQVYFTVISSNNDWTNINPLNAMAYCVMIISWFLDPSMNLQLQFKKEA